MANNDNTENSANGKLPRPRRHARRTMLGWIGAECWETRERAGVARSDIASAMGGVDQSTIYRFEIAQVWPTKLGVDRLVAVYGELAGEDPRKMWLRAARRFDKHGAPPLARPGGPDLLAEAEAEPDELARRLARTSQQPEEDSGEPETPAPKRRQRRS